jgi:hypothetical protein
MQSAPLAWANQAGQPVAYAPRARRNRRSRSRGAQVAVSQRPRAFVAPAPQHPPAVFLTSRRRRRLNNPANANYGTGRAPLQSYGRSAVLAGSESMSLTKTVSNRLPPTIRQVFVGAWPIRESKTNSTARVYPSSLGFLTVTQLNITVANTSSLPHTGDVLVRLFPTDPDLNGGGEEAEDDRTVEFPVPNSMLPQDIDMSGFAAAEITSISGKLVVHAAITGTVDKYVL